MDIIGLRQCRFQELDNSDFNDSRLLIVLVENVCDIIYQQIFGFLLEIKIYFFLKYFL